MSSADIFLSALFLVSLHPTAWELEGQNTRAAKAPRRVVNAYCDDIGAHVVYDSVGLIRFRGHFPKGGYDVHTDGRNDFKEPAPTPAVR
jgi:hypothetical protein